MNGGPNPVIGCIGVVVVLTLLWPILGTIWIVVSRWV